MRLIRISLLPLGVEVVPSGELYPGYARADFPQ